ncbi:MAG TPA: hypothetical protein VFV99_09535 [Kofleriaceae bacterium]|nr:hypothetical protein [Kofleriaceae bacterium]
MKNFAARHLAAIASLDGGLAQVKDPEFALLLRQFKSDHQESFAQVMALARLEHRNPPRGWRGANTLMKLEGRLAQLRGTTLTTRVLHFIEDQFTTAYREAEAESEGMRHQVLAALAAKAERRRAVLDAHLAPKPATFASLPARTCMRCLLDRPGAHPALTRSNPHTYVCAACHDEVRTEFPEDLARQIESWPLQVRESRIITKALSRTSKQRAHLTVHARLAGQPETPETQAAPMRLPARAAQPPATPSTAPLVVERAPEGLETSYLERLFDYKKLRSDW